MTNALLQLLTLLVVLLQAFSALILVCITGFYAYKTNQIAESDAKANELTAEMIRQTVESNLLIAKQIEKVEKANEISEALVRESIKQRIDSTAPMVSLDISIKRITTMTLAKDKSEWRDDDQWQDLEIPTHKDRMVQMTLGVIISNTGESPAIIPWANTPFAHDFINKESHDLFFPYATSITLIPGQTLEGYIRVKKTVHGWLDHKEQGQDLQVREYELSFDDVRLGRMHGIIKWRAILDPITLTDNKVTLTTVFPLNTSGPTLIIEYPNLSKDA